MPTSIPTQPPAPQPTQPPITGVNGNPWGYTFQSGNLIYNPPSNFCAYFNCILSFWKSTNRDEWRAYWKEVGQPWRTEPEISNQRQEYLAQRRMILPNIEDGIYPFKNIKLNRADIEWLLATLDGYGPVDWDDESQKKREGGI